MTNFAFSRQACTVNLFFFPSTFWDVMLYDHAVNLETLWLIVIYWNNEISSLWSMYILWEFKEHVILNVDII